MSLKYHSKASQPSMAQDSWLRPWLSIFYFEFLNEIFSQTLMFMTVNIFLLIECEWNTIQMEGQSISTDYYYVSRLTQSWVLAVLLFAEDCSRNPLPYHKAFRLQKNHQTVVFKFLKFFFKSMYGKSELGAPNCLSAICSRRPSEFLYKGVV